MSEIESPQAFPGVAHFTGASHHEGMSLRDWFAGQALVGLLSYYGNEGNERAADHAYQLADAMLIERAKATGKPLSAERGE